MLEFEFVVEFFALEEFGDEWFVSVERCEIGFVVSFDVLIFFNLYNTEVEILV